MNREGSVGRRSWWRDLAEAHPARGDAQGPGGPTGPPGDRRGTRPPPAPEPQRAHDADRPDGFLQDILERIGEVMGARAGAATIRYAAHSEGRRIAEGFRLEDLARLLERLDAVAGHRTRLLEAGPPVRLEIEPGELKSGTFGRGLVLGVLEGALGQVLGHPVKAYLEADHGAWTVVVQQEEKKHG